MTLVETIETTEITTIADTTEETEETPEVPQIPEEETEETSQAPEDPHSEEASKDTHSEEQLPETEIPDVQPMDEDFSNVTLPSITRQRGRPKGTVNWVIGLPKKRKTTEKEGKDEKPRSKKAKVKMNQVVNRIQLSRIPGSEDWVCS